MKYTCKRILALLLAVLCVFLLIGCDGEESDTVRHGISIDSNTAYSEQTIAYAEQTILSLVRYAYSELSPFDSFSEKLETRLAGYADKICAITVQNPVSEEQYLSMMDILARDGESAIDELLDLRSGESTEWGRIRRLYLDLTYIFGSEYVASMLYDICLFIYDAKYERAMEKFESFAYPWYKEEAEALAEDKAVFSTCIDREDFSALIRCGTATAELFSHRLDGLSDNFSDAELLQIVKTLDLEKIDVSKDGWTLMISYALPAEPIGADSPYQTKIRYMVGASGDSEKLAAVMNEVMTLVVSITEKLTAEDIKEFREGDNEKLAISVFSRFSDEDWEMFSKVTAVELSKEQYSLLAEAEYGDSYLEYLESLKNVSFEDVRQAFGTEEFYSILLDYLAGICPAMSYEVNQ